MDLNPIKIPWETQMKHYVIAIVTRWCVYASQSFKDLANMDMYANIAFTCVVQKFFFSMLRHYVCLRRGITRWLRFLL